MNATKPGAWVVVCDDYTVRCSTQEAADRRRQQIEQAGHCLLEHRVEQSR